MTASASRNSWVGFIRRPDDLNSPPPVPSQEKWAILRVSDGKVLQTNLPSKRECLAWITGASKTID
jgi:hypothetical protein